MDKLALTPAQRLASAALGVTFLAAGARGRTLGDAGLALGGAGLLFWAFTSPAARPPEPEKDIVEIASEESFPASDAPAW